MSRSFHLGPIDLSFLADVFSSASLGILLSSTANIDIKRFQRTSHSNHKKFRRSCQYMILGISGCRLLFPPFFFLSTLEFEGPKDIQISWAHFVSLHSRSRKKVRKSRVWESKEFFSWEAVEEIQFRFWKPPAIANGKFPEHFPRVSCTKYWSEAKI